MTIKPQQEMIDVALGRRPADLVLKNAHIFNVFTGRFFIGDVAIAGGYIAGVGEYSGNTEMDLSGKYLTPGFIDGHVHMESSMVSPFQFARAVVPAGTTTVFADPHEIANVAGMEGVHYILRITERLPMRVYIMLPSCVPATALEHAGAKLEAGDLQELIRHPRVLGLGELMNVPGVLHKDTSVLEKIRLAEGKIIDGHAPGLTGKELTAYIAAGISSDHECITPEEATERLAQGMHVMLREGSAAKNLLKLLPAVTPHTVRQCMLATDDRHPEDLIEQGHINYLVKIAIDAGTDIAWALQMATINTARYFGIRDLGAVAPGYRADLLVFDDLKNWQPVMVFQDGNMVAQAGKAMFNEPSIDDRSIRNTMNLGPVILDKLRIPAHSSTARVIGLIPGQIVTTLLEIPLEPVAGEFVADPAKDILKLAVWERHHGTGCVGAGLVHGFGLAGGAIASTIAHDSHNLVIVGANDEDMLLAVKEMERIGGGLVITNQKQVLGTLPLPLAGLMTNTDVGAVGRELALLRQIAIRLGVKDGFDPFMTLAFLSLPVIPALKLTDAGLVDVTNYRLTFVSV